MMVKLPMPMTLLRSLLPVLAALLPAALAAQAPPATAAPGAPAAPLSEGYVLGPGDVVEVAVLGRDDFRVRVPVGTDGEIQLPLIKSVRAANRTVIQLREEIARELVKGGYFVDPVVAVSIASYASRYVVVLGKVGTPGLVPIDRAYRVSEILARVGGVQDAAGSQITLRRDTGEELELNLEAIATGGDAGDPLVQPGDKLYVAPAKVFYIYGQVAAPGSYPIARDMTLRMALARGGGLTALGSDKKIKVFREGREQRVRDLSSALQDGDVITVGERFF